MFPYAIEDFLFKTYGDWTTVEELNGVNEGKGTSCYRLFIGEKSFIVKKAKEKREYDVYNSLSGFFKDKKISIPSTYYTYQDRTDYWFVIEDIPHLLPKERWKGDTEQIKVLFNLHFNTWNKTLSIDKLFDFRWSKELTKRALSLLPSTLEVAIEQLHLKSETIFSPVCYISGDPNPTNWGIRNNGELVLFDWERTGYASPAIDLAITIPSLGTLDKSLEFTIASTYINFWKGVSIEFPYSIQELTEQIVIAKMWSALDFLVNNADTLEEDLLKLHITRLIEKFKVEYPDLT
ncbi:hypothetical protein ACTHQ0_25715 [Priestia megaterium]|uniref:hypothetical protein n=1 Tax=Priestia megaterium TaxID=1404 RepID=UPI003F7F999C